MLPPNRMACTIIAEHTVVYFLGGGGGIESSLILTPVPALGSLYSAKFKNYAR